MIISILFLLFMLVAIVYRRGYDLYFFSYLGILAYYYPVVIFDQVLLTGITITVEPEAQFIIWFTLLMVFGASYRYPIPFERNSRPLTTKERQSGLYFSVFMIIVAFLMIPLLISHGSFSFVEVDKVALSEELGYDYRLFETAAALAFVSALFVRSVPLALISSGFAIVQLLLGGRFLLLLYGCLSLFFFCSKDKRINVALLILVGFFGYIMIAVKAAYYRLPSIEQLYELASELLDLQSGMLMIANPESSGTSAVFCEILRTDFHLHPVYLFDSIVTIIPFVPKLFNITITGFADYYKGIVFFSEGDSFASSLFAVFYSLAGIFGVFVFTALIIIVAEAVGRQVWGSRSIEFRATALCAAITFALVSHRSDIIFNITILRSIILLGLVGYFAVPFMSAIEIRRKSRTVI